MTKTLRGAVIELSGGNVRNSHFYLRGMPWLPKSTVGGTSESEVAAEALEVTFCNGAVISTDIAGDKMILRNREAVGRFFSDIGAVEGTRIIVEQTGPRSINVSKR